MQWRIAQADCPLWDGGMRVATIAVVTMTIATSGLLCWLLLGDGHDDPARNLLVEFIGGEPGAMLRDQGEKYALDHFSWIGSLDDQGEPLSRFRPTGP